MRYSSLKRIILFAALALTFGSTSVYSQLFKVVSVTGYVYDELTRESVDGVKVSFLDETGKPNISITHSHGYYLVTSLKPGKKYHVRIEKPNYFQTEYDFEAPNTDKYEEISHDYLLKPLRVGVKLPIAVSVFDPKKSKQRDGAEDFLNEIAKALIINPNVSIEIRSYPDDAQDKTFNQKLTTERCAAIQSYLAKNGISASRVTVKANDSIDPINPPPNRKQAKGKRYIGKVYVVVTKI